MEIKITKRKFTEDGKCVMFCNILFSMFYILTNAIMFGPASEVELTFLTFLALIVVEYFTAVAIIMSWIILYSNKNFTYKYQVKLKAKKL